MWQKSLVNFVKVICTVFILLMINGCNSSSYAYGDNSSDKNMVNNILAHYQIWQKTPYTYGGDTLKGTDCSGLVMNFYQTYYKKALPRVTAKQADFGDNVTNLNAGDLVFFKTGKGKTGLHVGIYYKNGKFLHVSSSKGVIWSDLSEKYWQDHYWKAKRVWYP